MAVRREGSLDTGRQATVGEGIGLYLLRNFQAEMAHGDNAFPAVRPEFGRAHLLSATLCLGALKEGWLGLVKNAKRPGCGSTRGVSGYLCPAGTISPKAPSWTSGGSGSSR